jgi:hypothetical protein
MPVIDWGRGFVSFSARRKRLAGAFFLAAAAGVGAAAFGFPFPGSAVIARASLPPGLAASSDSAWYYPLAGRYEVGGLIVKSASGDVVAVRTVRLTGFSGSGSSHAAETVELVGVDVRDRLGSYVHVEGAVCEGASVSDSSAGARRPEAISGPWQTLASGFRCRVAVVRGLVGGNARLVGSVHRADIAGLSADGPCDLRLAGVAVRAAFPGQSWLRIDILNARDLRRTEVATSVPGDVPYSFGSFSASGLSMGPGPATMSLASYDQANEYGSDGSIRSAMVLKGGILRITGPLAVAAALVAPEIGSSGVRFEANSEMAIDPKAGSVALNRTEVAIRGLGTLRLSGSFGVDRALLADSPASAVTLRRLKMEWHDAGLVPGQVPGVSASRRQDETLAAHMLALQAGLLASGLFGDDDVGGVLSGFFDRPGTLVLRVDPKSPLSLRSLASMSAAGLPRALGLSLGIE